MISKYLILVDENPQKDTLKGIKDNLHKEGIDLIYKEFNPTNYQVRSSSGDIDFDVDTFKNDILSLDYFKYADMILSDYNLVADVVNGYEILKIVRELGYTNKKKVILYSAKIEGVISDILKSGDDFENEMIKWFYKRDKDIFNYLFPNYQGKTFGEIAVELETKSPDSIQFKKDLLEQIISYLCAINGL